MIINDLSYNLRIKVDFSRRKEQPLISLQSRSLTGPFRQKKGNRKTGFPMVKNITMHDIGRLTCTKCQLIQDCCIAELSD